jgi:hypothetical protein
MGRPTRRPLPPASRLATFFVFVFVVLASVDALINVGLKRVKTGEFGAMNQIISGRINATVLISGSSRALNHYDPREIARQTGVDAWNIGLNGSQTDMQLAVLETYLRHNKPPALLIHNLDSFTFVTSRHGLAFPDIYVPYLSEPAIYNALRQIDSSWWKARYLPLYGYAVDDMRFNWLFGVAELAGRPPQDVRVQGFEPRHAGWSEDFERFKHAHPDGTTFDIEPEAVQDLEQLIAAATSRGTRVLLVYSPVYYEMQQLDRTRPQVFAKFREIADRCRATLWDFSDSPLSRRRDLFYNSQHLNDTGATLFSAALARRLAGSALLDRSTGEQVSALTITTPPSH